MAAIYETTVQAYGRRPTAGESQRHIASLDGLIRRGDEGLAANFQPSDYHVVWDLGCADGETAFDRVRGPTTQELPHAVYRFYDTDDRLLYVGCTVEPDLRFAGHKSE